MKTGESANNFVSLATAGDCEEASEIQIGIIPSSPLELAVFVESNDDAFDLSMASV
jgi:hypothetical protein